ncbi:MAG: hypothetical protein OXK16_16405 [bacterium]|nr:hypothetical protein [bacterium]
MTVVPEARESAVAEHVAEALALLAQGEAKFGAGDTRQAGERLYSASVQAVVAASIQRGWDYNSHRANKNATFRLAKEYDDPFLAAGFTAAEKFHIHFHHGGMEDYQITGDRYTVRLYIERMAKLVEEYEAERAVETR